MEEEVPIKNPTSKFLCTPIGSLKKSFVKQKSSRKHAANTSLVYKQSLTSNNRQLARTLEKTKEELADALNANISLAHENSVLASKVLAFRRMAELKNEEVEREVQSRVQQRLHCISDMLSDVVRSRAVTTDLLTAAADASRGFTMKTLENLFDESIQYCSKLPSRIPTGAHKWHPRVTTCREQMDTTSDDLHDDDGDAVAEHKEPAHSMASLVDTATPTSAERASSTALPEANEDLPVSQSVVAAPEGPLSPPATGSDADPTAPVLHKPPLCHDEIPVGPRLSGSFCRPEPTQKSEFSDVPAPGGGLYEVVLSPPKIFKKYIDGTGLGTSSVPSGGARRNQPPVRRMATTASLTKCAASGTLPSTAVDIRDRRRSTFCFRPSQEAVVDNLPENTPLIADESDSILITSPFADISPRDAPLPVRQTEKLPEGNERPSDAVLVDEWTCPKASGSDVTSIGESTSAVAADVGSKTAVVNDARQAATSSGPVKAVSHSAAASRQMDIVMAKPGELHFVVGSRDGTRQPNPAEVRHAGSSRSKKRQTFVASSMKPHDGQLEEKAASSCAPSVFDFKGTPVACANKPIKDAMDTYELSLSESIVSELPRPQYRSEAAAVATAAARMPSSESGVHKTKNKEQEKKTSEVDPRLPSAELPSCSNSVASSKSAPPPTHVKLKKKKKSPSKHHHTDSSKENDNTCRAVSPSSKLVANKKLPLAACPVTPSKQVASVRVPVSPTPSHTATPARHEQNDSYNVFTDSIIERYTQECHDGTSGSPAGNSQRSTTKPTASNVLPSDQRAAESTSEGAPEDKEHENPRRRRCTSQINYAEPPLGKKLRRGDPGTSNIYGSEDSATADFRKRSSVKRVKGVKGPGPSAVTTRSEPAVEPPPQ